MVGTTERLAPRKEAFLTLIRSINFDEGEPKWVLPSGWTEKEGSGMRLATLIVGEENPPLEISVSGIRKADEWLLANVNRWRGQVGLTPIDGASIGDSTETILVGEMQVSVVDVTGPKRPPSRPKAKTSPHGKPPAHPTPHPTTSPEARMPSNEELRHFIEGLFD